MIKIYLNLNIVLNSNKNTKKKKETVVFCFEGYIWKYFNINFVI